MSLLLQMIDEFHVIINLITSSINITSVAMNLVDNFKLRAIISESITSLRFLDRVKPQDDISSELAGF